MNQEIGDADDGRPDRRVCAFMPKAEIVEAPPTATGGSVRAVRLTVRNYGRCAGASTWKTASERL